MLFLAFIIQKLAPSKIAQCYHFLLISFSLFRAFLLPKSLLSPFSLLLCHIISPKLLPLPLTISANSFTTAIQRIPRKYQREPRCNHIKTQPQNQKISTQKIPKTSLKISRKSASKTQKISFQNTQKKTNKHRKIASKT